jgi:RNase adaptor protein for sRNA GlmZ degradation
METLILPTVLTPIMLAMRIILISAGLKPNRTLPKADLYLDCRSIANPFHADPKISSMSGDAEVVQEWVEQRSEESIRAFLAQVNESILRLPIRRQGKDPFSEPFVICPFCAHGIHRSKAMKHILKRRLKMEGFSDVRVEGY